MTSNYVINTFNKTFYNKLHKKYTKVFFQLQSDYMLMEWARKYYEIPKELHVRDVHPIFCIWGGMSYYLNMRKTHVITIPFHKHVIK
jgi:hypothetical protein